MALVNQHRVYDLLVSGGHKVVKGHRPTIHIFSGFHETCVPKQEARYGQVAVERRKSALTCKKAVNIFTLLAQPVFLGSGWRVREHKILKSPDDDTSASSEVNGQGQSNADTSNQI